MHLPTFFSTRFPIWLHRSYICCAVKLLLIFGMSSSDVAISPEYLATYLTKIGQNLSSSSLVLSVPNSYQQVNKSSFRWPVICFATAPVSIYVIFTQRHQYLFTILESVNMFLNSSAAWSAVLKIVFNQETRKKHFSFHNFVDLSFQLLSLHQNWLIFFVVVQHPDILYALRCVSVYWYYFPLHLHYWNCFNTHCIIQNLHLSEISEWIWICYITNCLILDNISCYLMELALNWPPSFL